MYLLFLHVTYGVIVDVTGTQRREVCLVSSSASLQRIEEMIPTLNLSNYLRARDQLLKVLELGNRLHSGRPNFWRRLISSELQSMHLLVMHDTHI